MNPAQTLQQAAESFGAGDYTRAEALCQRVLDEAPRNVDAQHLLGILRLQGGRAAEAVPLLHAALQAYPADLGVLDALSAALMNVGEYAQAEEVVRRALSVDGELPIARLRLGMAVAAQGRWDEAARSFEEAIAGDPGFAEAHHHLGNALLELQHPREAAVAFQRALTLEPARADTHNALGLALLEQGELERARSCFERAVGLDPDHSDAHCNLGIVLQELRQWDAAIAQYKRALAIDAASAQARHNLGVLLLHRHEFEQGWPHLEQRLRRTDIRGPAGTQARSMEWYERMPHWRGPSETVAGQVAIWAEQGIGDQVLYSTLLPELIGAGVDFVYEMDGRLLAAYARAFPGSRFVAQEEPPQAVLRQASRVLLAGSLPGLLRDSRASFARQPRRLLTALPDRVARYRARLDAPGPGLKVALAWHSSRMGYLGLKKSVPLARFAPLLTLPGAHFADVQYGDTREERRAVEEATGCGLLHFDEVDYYNDLEEVLAILEACDLVVTTSNATAHLAGALGKRTWLLFPADHPPFHYWAHGGSHRSLWYPSVEIVSAAHLTDWEALIQHAAEKLVGQMGQKQATTDTNGD